MKRTYLLACAGLLIVLLCLTPSMTTPPKAPPADAKGRAAKRPDEIVECRVHLGPPPNGLSLELRITTRELIEELIEKPLSQARTDPDPAKYMILGQVTMTRRNGSKEGFLLFQPWGNIKRGGDYLITDLSGLRQAFRKKVENILEFGLK